MSKQWIAVRVALTGILSALFVGLVALPAAAASGITGRAEGGLPAAPVHPSGGSSLDVVIGGLAGLLIIGFAGAVLWYVARNRRTINEF